jgi:uracil-DNA glycosylase family protein
VTVVAPELEHVRSEARACRRCPLWQGARQTVFGVGPATSRLMFLGEAPGRQEDELGLPFVGAAGRLFDEALGAAGIERSEVYVTNTVKHRPVVLTGRSARNRAPTQAEVDACRLWLEQELAIVRPRVLCCLGAVAARAILGRAFRLTQSLGEWRSGAGVPHVLATLHPSVALIRPDPAGREAARRQLFADVAKVADRYRALGAQ